MIKKPWQRILALILAVAMTISIASFDFRNMRFKTKKNQLDDHYALAQTAMEENDYDTAMDHLNRCIRFFGRKTETEKKTDIYYRMACILLLVREDNEGAAEQIEKLLALDPSYYDAYALRAQAKLNLQEYDAAIADIETYIDLTGDKTAYSTLVAIYEALGDYDHALEALKLSGTDGAAWEYQRGAYMQELGRAEDAMLAFEMCAGDADFGASALYYAGSIRMDLEDYKTALTDLDAAIAAGADFNDLCFKRGLCEMALGDYQTAAVDFRKSLECEPYETDARCNLASCLIQLGEYGQAVEQLDLVISAEPGCETAYVLKAQAELSLEDYESAAEDLEQYIDLTGDPEGQNALNAIHEAIDQQNGAYADFQRALFLQENGQSELAAMYFEKCAGDSDYGAAALYNAGLLRSSLEQYGMAVADLLAAINAGVEVEGAYSMLAETYVRKAQAELTAERYDEAVSDLETYIRMTGDANGYVSLAAVYQLTADYDKALEALTLSGAEGGAFKYQRGVLLESAGRSEAAAQAFESCAGDSDFGAVGLYNAGVVRMELGDYAAAKADLTAAIEAGADYDGIYFKRGVCAMMLGAYEAAADDFRVSVRGESSLQDARCNLAACLMQAEKYTEAIDELDILMADVSYPAQAAYFRAVCRWQTEDYEGAVIDFTECIGKGIMMTECSYNRGLLRLALQNYEGAAEDFTVCIESGYEPAQSYYQRALAYEALGNDADCEADYQKYLELTEVSESTTRS